MNPRAIACTALLALVLQLGCRAGPQVASGFDSPADNVILVLVDTLRADRLGAYGYDLPTSPAIDVLAEGGAVFDRAYAAAPWTFPSAASLVTSLYPEAHGAYIHGEIRNQVANQVPRALGPEYTTLPEVLEPHGIRTALFADNPYLGYGIQQGFSKYRNARADARDQVTYASGWIERLGAEQRFFLLLHFIDVHEPNLPPERHRSHFKAARAISPDHLEWFARWRPLRAHREPGRPPFELYRRARSALYDASIRFVDEQVGRLMEAVDALRPGQQTAVIVTSDHGEEFWDHEALERQMYKDPRGVYGFGHGHTLFEELVRVPLVLYWRGRIRPGRHRAPVSLVDLMPTVLELMHVPHDGPGDGRSLVPALDGRPVARAPVLFSQPCFGREKQGLVAGDVKLIESDSEPILLFDLARDPQELLDVAASRSGELRRMRRDLLTVVSRSHALGEQIREGREPARADPPNAERQRRLRELGYVN